MRAPPQMIRVFLSAAGPIGGIVSEIPWQFFASVPGGFRDVFDRVWGPDYSQTSVFQDVEPLALSVVDGFNACIFAYGQTGSGKTFTMEGKSLEDPDLKGIIPRTAQQLFLEILSRLLCSPSPNDIHTDCFRSTLS